MGRLTTIRTVLGMVASIAAASICLGVTATPAGAVASDGADPAAGGSQGEVYVPIEQPSIEHAPARRPAAAQKRQSGVERAGEAVRTSMATAVRVPLAAVPGTSIPVWWVLLVLLAVPLARRWRSWTASMFD